MLRNNGKQKVFKMIKHNEGIEFRKDIILAISTCLVMILIVGAPIVLGALTAYIWEVLK